MPLLLPPSVSRELAERTASYNADLLRSLALDDPDPLLRRYSELLQQIHPRLILVRAREEIVPGVALKPGYYHILVRTDSAPWSAIPIEGADGEFTVPTSRVFEKLAAGDMREQRNLERWTRRQRDEHDTVERDKAHDREERREHLGDLVNAYSRTSVSMNDETPWTQNNSANSQRARDQAKKRKETGK